MRHSPDRGYNYIGHFMDHFSKFHVLFPIQRKTADEVSRMIEERVLAYFGPPKIFHSDNGREFVNQLIRAMFERWRGDVVFVNGRPRHSQSQGLVERGNLRVERKIAAIKQEEGQHLTEGSYPWSSWLPRIMFGMNRENHSTIKDSPYHVVFGKFPPSVFPGATKHCTNEEDLFSDKSEETDCGSLDVLDDGSDTSTIIDPDTADASIVESDEEGTKPSSPPTRHTSIRKRALDSTYTAASRMANFYNKRKRVKLNDFEKGDCVSVCVPKADRTGTDLPRIPCVIQEVYGHKVKSFVLVTEYGTLRERFRTGDLEAYSGSVKTGNSDAVISLREAAQKFHHHNKFTKSFCKCSSACHTNRCVCRANGIQCSTRCHHSTTCSNQPKGSSARKAKASYRSTVSASTTFNSGSDGSSRSASVQKSRTPSSPSRPAITSATSVTKAKPTSKSSSSSTKSNPNSNALGRTEWLSDRHMKTASDLLRASFATVGGLEDTLLQTNNSFTVPTGPYVQFLHIRGNHWVTISNILAADRYTVLVYDSMHSQPDSNFLSVVANYLYCPKDSFDIKIMNVQRQPNSYDCGVYAIAFATAVLHGDDPANLQFRHLRKHFQECCTIGLLTPFPSSVVHRQPKVVQARTEPLFCSCRGIYRRRTSHDRM